MSKIHSITLVGADEIIDKEEVEFVLSDGTWKNLKEVEYGPVNEKTTVSGLLILEEDRIIPLNRKVSVNEGGYVLFCEGEISYSTENKTKYICPVCDDDFDFVAEADRHYNAHKPSEYIIEWKLEGREVVDYES